MRTLGVILIVIGMLMSILGYGMSANVVCHCPAQLIEKHLSCLCVENLHNNEHIITYFGFGIISTGIILFIYGWKTMKSFITN
ncbi:MAG: hypothetical protein WA833_08685 [Nitrosotalea sp.]